MTTTLDVFDDAPAAVQDASVGLEVDVLDDPAAIASCWRDFERKALMSPYQSHAWVSAYDHCWQESRRPKRMLLRVRDGAGAVRALLPLDVFSRLGLTMATMPGAGHANFHMPLLAHGAAPSADEWAEVLQRAGQAAGIDLFTFRHQPQAWHGQENALAAVMSQPSPSNGYQLTVDFPAAEARTRILSPKRRRVFKSKERALSERGAFVPRLMESEEDVRRALAAFLAQKAERFAAQKIANPFADPGIQAFLLAACLPQPDGSPPPLRLYALLIGDEIVATRAGTVWGTHISVMFHSFDQRPEIARSSPAEVLFVYMIEAMTAEGFTHFDLGVGDLPYKRVFCKEVMELRDGIVPVSAKGRLLAPPLKAAVWAKRRVKQSERLSALYQRLKPSPAA